MEKFKLKYVGWVSALIMTGAGFTLTGCQNKASSENQIDVSCDKESELQERIADLGEQKKKLQGEVSNLEETRNGLQEEVSSLENSKDGLQEEVSSLEETRDGLQGEIGDLQEKKEYNLENLYLLDTSKIAPEQRGLYYILERKDDYSGSPICYQDENYNIDCQFVRINGYDVSEGKVTCVTNLYSSIGLQPNIEFHFSNHFHWNNYDTGAMDDPQYLTVISSDYSYYKEIEIHDWFNFTPEEREKCDAFNTAVVPLMDVLKDEDVKLSYTTSEIKELSDQMNSDNYFSSEPKDKVLLR